MAREIPGLNQFLSILAQNKAQKLSDQRFNQQMVFRQSQADQAQENFLQSLGIEMDQLEMARKRDEANLVSQGLRDQLTQEQLDELSDPNRANKELLAPIYRYLVQNVDPTRLQGGIPEFTGTGSSIMPLLGAQRQATPTSNGKSPIDQYRKAITEAHEFETKNLPFGGEPRSLKDFEAEHGNYYKNLYGLEVSQDPATPPVAWGSDELGNAVAKHFSDGGDSVAAKEALTKSYPDVSEAEIDSLIASNTPPPNAIDQFINEKYLGSIQSALQNLGGFFQAADNPERKPFALPGGSSVGDLFNSTGDITGYLLDTASLPGNLGDVGNAFISSLKNAPSRLSDIRNRNNPITNSLYNVNKGNRGPLQTDDTNWLLNFLGNR